MIISLNLLQIPDERTGDDIIDAVVVDEEAVGSEGRGCGGKILYAKGALDRYFSQHKLKDLEVHITEPVVPSQIKILLHIRVSDNISRSCASIFVLQTSADVSDAESEVEPELPSIVAL